MKYIFAFLLGIFLFTHDASAMPPTSGLCAEREKIVDTLENRYAEAPVSMGLSGSGGVVEVFSSEKGSWTIIMTRPSGRSCVLSAGDAWEEIKGSAILGDEKI